MKSELDSQRMGTGNWAAFPVERMDEVFEAAEVWRREIKDVANPWLCWCVDDDWCIWQQKLVIACGWTPVVGNDRGCGDVTVLPGSVYVDFNAKLQLPSMWMHFPLEFAFRFCSKLAFWHSDVLAPLHVMQQMAEQFESVADGGMVSVLGRVPPRNQLKRLWHGAIRRNASLLRNFRTPRWFEVVGCTTAGASEGQFNSGCGFWRNIASHPNCQAKIAQMKPHYDHGVGIWYWEKYFGGRVAELCIDIDPYHYVSKGKQRRHDTRGMADKGAELRATHDLQEITKSLFS